MRHTKIKLGLIFADGYGAGRMRLLSLGRGTAAAGGIASIASRVNICQTERTGRTGRFQAIAIKSPTSQNACIYGGILAFSFAPTDQGWYQFLRARPDITEVNFWRPGGTAFRAIAPGAPFFFKLKRQHNAIGGFGLFARAERLTGPIRM